MQRVPRPVNHVIIVLVQIAKQPQAASGPPTYAISCGDDATLAADPLGATERLAQLCCLIATGSLSLDGLGAPAFCDSLTTVS